MNIRAVWGTLMSPSLVKHTRRVRRGLHYNASAASKSHRWTALEA